MSRRLTARRVTVGLVTVGLLAGGGYAYQSGLVDDLLGLDRAEADAAPAPTRPPATTKVTKQTLVQTEEVEGTIGYGEERKLGAGLGGTVTKLAAEGATVKRGQTLYRVDDEPVQLWYGKLPMYRTLEYGVSDGADVKQLEQNLVALGYGDDLEVDEEFTGYTAEVVEEWQDDIGLEETGRVEVGQVAVLPSSVRISSQQAELGAKVNAGGPVLGYTGTERLVTIELDVEERDLVAEGAKVNVVLPDDSTIPGTISDIGTVAQEESEEDAGPGGDTTSTIEVTVELGKASAAAAYDQAPVEVEVVGAERKDVLTVPVMALLALSEGGYGVELVDGDTASTVAVELGLFADGRVEVSGEGIAEGVRVGVPKS